MAKAKPVKEKSLESWIWDAACSIRGAKDAPKYKDYIPPLTFTKRLCDVFDDKINRVEAEVSQLQDIFRTFLHELVTANIRANELEITE